MPGTPTTKYAIPTLAGTTLARDIDTEVNAGLNAIDSKMVGYSSGVLASRPTSTGGTPGIAGRRYRATDTGQEFIDTGTGWVEIAQGDSRGKSVVATEESRTNTAYGLLSTPDRVQSIVLPTDGLIVVAYMATWRESVANAARAAIFVGGNQLKYTVFNQAAPVVQEATHGVSPAGVDRPLLTVPVGLQSINDGSSPAYTGDVTTGQAIGGAGTLQFGGLCQIFAAAGTYDISVQFKASSGSVTAKNRKLWVRAIAF